MSCFNLRKKKNYYHKGTVLHNGINSISHAFKLRRTSSMSHTSSKDDHFKQSCIMESSINELKLNIGISNIPHPEKIETGGEDSYFQIKNAFGVADGVGGWRESGVNPKEYSLRIVEIVKEYMEGKIKNESFDDKDSALENSYDETDIRTAIDHAHRQTRIPGSCTISVLRLDSFKKQITALNLGDSGFCIIRNGSMIYQSIPQQHFFDCPRQLGAFPEYCDGTDTSDDADEYIYDVIPGDIIIMGTDGLWDNLFDVELVKIAAGENIDNMELLARKIAENAHENSINENFDSPYMIAAIKEGYDIPWYEKILKARIVDKRIKLGKLTGGKMDDITVIAARVDIQSQD